MTFGLLRGNIMKELIKSVSIKEHDSIKQELLEVLARQNSSPYWINDGWYVHNTDWLVDAGKPREYCKFLYPILAPYIHKMLIESYGPDYENTTFKMINCHFNQYHKGEYHNWHRHPNSSWHFIYYVELPKDSPPTEIRIPLTQEIVSPDVKEGDMLMAPSLFFHRSKPNASVERKTAIVFNFS